VPSHFLRAFRHRNYQLFFTGQLISFTGTWMQSVAESWLVYRLTGSSALLGVTAFCSQIPVFVLAPLAGTVADRGNRHRIMVVTQTISMLLALALGLLTITGRVQVWQVLVLASGLGIVNAFDIPARQSFVATMVGREDLMNAIALNSSLVNGARVVGPAVAGLLVAAVGEGWCFLINGISYVAVIAALLMMDVPATQRKPHLHSPFRDMVEGFRFVARTAPVRALLLLLGTISLAGMPPSWFTTSFRRNRSYARPSRICAKRSPELSETMSQLSVGRMPWRAHASNASRPMPMLSSVSGEIDTFAPACARRSQSVSSSVLQCTWTCSGPRSPCACISFTPPVIAEPHTQPVCATRRASTRRAARISSTVSAHGIAPTSVSATPILTSPAPSPYVRAMRAKSARRAAWSGNAGFAGFAAKKP